MIGRVIHGLILLVLVGRAASAEKMTGRYRLASNSCLLPVRNGDQRIHPRCAPEVEQELDRWHRKIDVEVRGTVIVNREVWKLLPGEPFNAVREPTEDDPFRLVLLLSHRGTAASGSLVLMQLDAAGEIACAVSINLSGRHAR